jgi:hypothetical protein
MPHGDGLVMMPDFPSWIRQIAGSGLRLRLVSKMADKPYRKIIKSGMISLTNALSEHNKSDERKEESLE